MKWIDSKTIVISGASSGIGRGLTKFFIEKYNCKVIGIGRNEKKMQSLIEQLGQKAHLFEYRLFDVGVEQNWKDFALQLDRDNICVDVLINNAGVLPPFERLEKQDTSLLSSTMQTNFYSYVYAYKSLLHSIRKSNTPAVINIISSDALAPLIGTAIYSASKSAIKAFGECIKEEHRKEIFVSNIYPGYTKTDIFRDQNTRPSHLMDMVSMNADKMVRKIGRGIVKKKGRMIIGTDAKFMNFMYKVFPRTSQRFFARVFKKFRVPLYDNVFDKK